jgi:glycine C-acetyltransferase
MARKKKNAAPAPARASRRDRHRGPESAFTISNEYTANKNIFNALRPQRTFAGGVFISRPIWCKMGWTQGDLMYQRVKYDFKQELIKIKDSGLFKEERTILSSQKPEIHVQFPAGSEAREVLNFCSNNYLGLANHPDIIRAAHEALDRYGFGLASVRFICGTQDLHKRLEERISQFYGTEDTILYSSCFDANGGLFESLLGTEDTALYSSCFDANGGLFEVLLGEQDAVISDTLNHASLIDGIRLCKATRLRYAHSDMTDLEAKLRAATSHRLRLIATDGVFSMDGDLAKLDRIVELADRYDAAVIVDDSHATGVLGRNGRGTPDHFAVADRIEIVTSTLGKTLGGAAGGFTSGRKEIVELLRQRSRPYLFSNSLPPVIAAAARRAVILVAQGDQLRARLRENAAFFRAQLTTLGFRLIPGEHPIIPIMLGDSSLATRMAERLLEEGIYVVGFSYPVVPEGQARIRVQMSAAHTHEQLERASAAFATVGRELGVIS